MADFTSTIYDKPRKWIRDAREHQIDWADLETARRKNNEELQTFLETRYLEDFWPQMSISDWKYLVKQQEEYENKTFIVNLMHGIAQVNDKSQDNAVTVPDDERSSWQLYRKKLLADGFKQETVDEIERTTLRILKRLSNNTTETGPVKGLVIGNVQSGKTANMAGLMAMAADWGWNMFIVLSGTIDNLRVQTQNRLFNDLNQEGNLFWRSLEHLSKNVDISLKAQNLHFDQTSKERYFTVCLKNSTRLKDLIQWAQADRNKQQQMKILLIDDEADQAGINTAKIDSGERRRISKLICALVNGQNEKAQDIDSHYQAMNYIGYTATPYANLLNEGKEESIYPRSFITTLTVSKEYFGPQQIFGYNGDGTSFDGMDIVRTINDTELDELRSIHDGTSFKAPDSLIDSALWFLCGAACMRIWKYKKPISMLVHTSQKTAHHSAVANVISDFFTHTSHDEIIKKAECVWYDETERFTFEKFCEQYPDYDIPAENINRYPDFCDVEKELRIILEDGLSHIKLDADDELTYNKGIHLCIDNCTNNGVYDGMHIRLAYPESSKMPSPAPLFIVVGGATLSRGLTLEGLISTYFLRSVGQADTLMQMGRWFGYRKKYELIPRVWMTEKTKKQFEFLAALDQELRDEIQYMDVTGRSPAEYGPKVKNTPKVGFLRITAKNRMQSATESTMDYTGASNQTYLFENDAEKLNRNIELTEEFLKGMGEKWIPENDHFRKNAVWKNVDFSLVRKYIEKFEFCSRLKVFNDTTPLLEWLQSVTDERKLGNWNVVVAGKKDADNGSWTLPDGTIINKVNRSRKISTREVDNSILDIGVLRFPRDLLSDVDLSSVQDAKAKKEISDFIESNSSKSAMAFRDKAGLETTPQLLIYRIDKDSVPQNENSNREDLAAACDIIGLSIYIPGGRIGTTYASTVSINMSNDVFDGDADLEDTNEN